MLRLSAFCFKTDGSLKRIRKQKFWAVVFNLENSGYTEKKKKIVRLDMNYLIYGPFDSEESKR